MSTFLWLASYPKSGNTWLRLALASLKQGGAAPDFTARIDSGGIASDRRNFDLLLGVDSADLLPAEIDALRPRLYEAEAARHKGPLPRKVHDAWTLTGAGEPMFPPAVTKAAIYLVRDPRDVAISYAHHIGGTIDRTIASMAFAGAMMVDGRRAGNIQLPQRLLSWSDHVRSWRTAPIPLLLLRYEDMLADPAGALARAAHHLGLDASAEAIATATAATRFDALRAAEAEHGFVEKPREAKRFFRRGVAGEWRETLTPDQAARIEAAHGAVMAELDYL